ncbi:MAG: hypothetical protein RIS76_282 [Verrucomicrobiota bacterium]
MWSRPGGASRPPDRRSRRGSRPSPADSRPAIGTTPGFGSAPTAHGHFHGERGSFASTTPRQQTKVAKPGAWECEEAVAVSDRKQTPCFVSKRCGGIGWIFLGHTGILPQCMGIRFGPNRPTNCRVGWRPWGSGRRTWWRPLSGRGGMADRMSTRWRPAFSWCICPLESRSSVRPADIRGRIGALPANCCSPNWRPGAKRGWRPIGRVWRKPAGLAGVAPGLPRRESWLTSRGGRSARGAGVLQVPSSQRFHRAQKRQEGKGITRGVSPNFRRNLPLD